MSVDLHITMNTNKCHLVGDPVLIQELRAEFKYRHPQQFYIRPHMPRGWDGYINQITDAGYLATGLFPKLAKILKENDITYEVDDLRLLPEIGKIPKKVGNDELRDYQADIVRLVVQNFEGGVYFPRGIISAATNAGKTITMVGIHKSFKNARTLILLRDSLLFDQFLKYLPTVFKEGEYGYLQGKRLKWGNITVAMAQTLVNHIEEFREELERLTIVLVDECDQANNKTFTKIIKYTYNSTVRVGLSGTVFKRNLAKDRPKIQFLLSYFGNELFKITNKELMDRGVSSRVTIKINLGNTRDSRLSDYDQVYKAGITNNEARNLKILERVKFYLDRGVSPILVVCRYHEHVENVYNLIHKHLGLKYSMGYVHVDVKGREKTIEQFREGKLNILVASLLIARGQNMPLIQSIIYAAGGDSPEIPLQVLGRGTRTSSTKNKWYFDDFYDMGEYLERHSKHRLAYYQAEQLKLINLIKGNTIKKKRRRNAK
jgi:superfamily II DNA or RNA helicase